MSDKKMVNRIPYEDIKTLESWSLPAMAGKKVASGKYQKQLKGKESIEDVKPEDLKPITAEQLQKVVQDAENEGREKGYQEGLKKGFTEGQIQGLKNGEKKAYDEYKTSLLQKTQIFQSMADALLDPVSMQDKALENVIIDMAVHFAKHLINRELSEDPSSLFDIVERTVESLPTGAKNIRIFLSADDVELAHEAFDGTSHNWIFSADSSLSRGGCRVESDQSLIDYSIEKRIDLMLEKVELQGEVDPDSMPPIGSYVPEVTTNQEEDAGNKKDAMTVFDELETDIEDRLQCEQGESDVDESFVDQSIDEPKSSDLGDEND